MRSRKHEAQATATQRDLSYESCLIEYGLATLETRRLGGDQIQCRSVLNIEWL